ncbi:hypothetical protein SCHPADRAFT_823375, partial [Schizopora paradoxa]
EVVKASHSELVAWLVLNVWPSHLGLPLLVATILLARNIRRHATFINMIVTWMIVGFSSSLLLYAGFQTGPEPPKSLCLLQASLLYAQPGMTSLSAFALVFQVFYVVHATFREKDPHHHQTLRKWILLVLPYLALVVFASLTAYVGATNTEMVSRQRRFFYCSVKSTSLTSSITTFSALVLFVTMILELWIVQLTYRHWRILRSNELNENIGLDLNLLIRIVAFSTWCIMGMSLSLLSLKAPESPVPDLALATMGSAVVLVFGTQRDVLHAWKFCRRRNSSGMSSSPSIHATTSTTKLNLTESRTSMTHVHNSSPSRWNVRLPLMWRSMERTRQESPIRGFKISNPVLREDMSVMAAPRTSKDSVV